MGTANEIDSRIHPTIGGGGAPLELDLDSSGATAVVNHAPAPAVGLFHSSVGIDPAGSV